MPGAYSTSHTTYAAHEADAAYDAAHADAAEFHPAAHAYGFGDQSDAGHPGGASDIAFAAGEISLSPSQPLLFKMPVAK